MNRFESFSDYELRILFAFMAGSCELFAAEALESNKLEDNHAKNYDAARELTIEIYNEVLNRIDESELNENDKSNLL